MPSPIDVRNFNNFVNGRKNANMQKYSRYNCIYLCLNYYLKTVLTLSKDDSRTGLFETLKKFYHPKGNRVAYQKWVQYRVAMII